MNNNDNNLRRFKNYEIDLEKKILWFENAPVELPVKAVELLCELVERGGEVVTKDELLDKIWNDSFVEEGVLPQNVYLLRKLFKEHGISDNLIQTVPRRGYRFAGEVAETFEEETIIERETFERKLIAGGELSDEEFRQAIENLSGSQAARFVDLYENRQAESGNRSERKFYLATFAVALFSFAAFGLIVWLWIYPNYARKNSASVVPPNFDKNVRYERVSESGRVVAVGLSPDNQHAVYVVDTPENQYKMILHHLPTESETVIIEPQDNFPANIKFSPDGNYIFYIGNDENGKRTAYKMPLYGGVSQPVLQDFAHYFNVSPDGEWLVFVRRVPEIPAHYLEIARSRDGSERRTVAVFKDKLYLGIWGTAPAWSPDGKKLIAAAFIKNDDETKPAKSVLFEVDVSSGKYDTVKTPEHWRGVHEPYYAPDGKAIYLKVRENIGEPVQIWKLQIPSGEARNLTDDTNDYREFRVASDESFLITAVWAKSENLFLVSTENPQNIKQLTFDSQGQNGESGLNWTIDGKNLIYTKTKGYGVGNLWMMNVETNEVRQLTKEENAAQSEIDVTPDGKSVIYASSRTGKFQIWRMNFDGTNQKQLTDGKSVYFSEISKDGKWIYYADNGLWKIPVGGGEADKIMEESPGRVRFSPTDPKIFSAYFHDEKSKNENPWKHAIFDLDNLTEYKDLKLVGSGGRSDWSPDGKKIYYIGRGESFNNIWTISPETMETEQITNFQDQRIANASLSPDGKTIAVSRGSATGNILKISGFQ